MSDEARDEFPDLIASVDQAMMLSRQIARLIGSYYEHLCFEGLSDEVAIPLLVAYQDRIVGWGYTE